MTACAHQLRHTNGFFSNSDQEVAEHPKTTFQGFYRKDEGSNCASHPPTLLRHALDCLSPKVVKTLSLHIFPLLGKP